MTKTRFWEGFFLCEVFGGTLFLTGIAQLFTFVNFVINFLSLFNIYFYNHAKHTRNVILNDS